MKKSNTKLQFRASTVRVLQGSELERVNGGAPTADCSNNPTVCSHPPQHTGGSSNAGGGNNGGGGNPGGGQHP